MDLQHKVAWVVGASTGIGAALARELQARGAKVAISARSSTQLDEVSGGAMLAVTADIRDAAALDAAHQRVSAELGAPDIVVIAAPDSIPMGIDDWDRAGFAAVVDITLTGASNTIGAVLPTMLSRGSGTILGFVAPAGYRGLPGEEAYGAAKAGVRNLLESLAIDVHDRGLNVVTVAPSGVDTELAGRTSPRLPARVSADTAARAICDGLERDRSRIAFPGRIAEPFRLVRLAPRSLWPALARRLTRPQD